MEIPWVVRVHIQELGWAVGAEERGFSRLCRTFYPLLVLCLPEDFCHGL